MDYYRISLYLLFGILPSLIWLFYYLSKDLHPEPRRLILKIFLWGALITFPVYLIQKNLSGLLDQVQLFPFLHSYPFAIEIIRWFLIIAFTEELLKYLVVKLGVMGSYALDEPVDIMLYMVVAALGFAAVENILYLFSPQNSVYFSTLLQTTAAISFIRFISATFLHTLCSALLGYFLALASLRSKKKLRLVITGLVLATLLHGLYDFSIITLAGTYVGLGIPLLIIVGLCIFMVYDFNEIKKIKSICKL